MSRTKGEKSWFEQQSYLRAQIVKRRMVYISNLQYVYDLDHGELAEGETPSTEIILGEMPKPGTTGETPVKQIGEMPHKQGMVLPKRLRKPRTRIFPWKENDNGNSNKAGSENEQPTNPD